MVPGRPGPLVSARGGLERAHGSGPHWATCATELLGEGAGQNLELRTQQARGRGRSLTGSWLRGPAGEGGSRVHRRGPARGTNIYTRVHACQCVQVRAGVCGRAGWPPVALPAWEASSGPSLPRPGTPRPGGGGRVRRSCCAAESTAAQARGQAYCKKHILHCDIL